MNISEKDILDYKIKWEHLDWFWNSLEDYNNGKILEDDVLYFFSQLDYADKEWCYKTLQAKSCVQLKDKFKECLNQCFVDALEKLGIKNDITIDIDHTSPMIYTIKCIKHFSYMEYNMHEIESIRLKVSKNNYLSLDFITQVKDCIEKLKQIILFDNNILKVLSEVSNLQFIKEIHPSSHYVTKKYPLSNLFFTVVFQANIYNDYIVEEIGSIQMPSYSLSNDLLHKKYLGLYAKRMNELETEFSTEMLKHDSLLQNTIKSIKDSCEKSEIPYLRFEISNNYKDFSLVIGSQEILRYHIGKDVVLGSFEEDLLKLSLSCISEFIEKYKIINHYVSKINNCSNGLWNIYNGDDGYAHLQLHDNDNNGCIGSVRIDLYHCDDIETKLLSEMHGLFDYVERYKGIRFLEVK